MDREQRRNNKASEAGSKKMLHDYGNK